MRVLRRWGAGAPPRGSPPAARGRVVGDGRASARWSPTAVPVRRLRRWVTAGLGAAVTYGRADAGASSLGGGGFQPGGRRRPRGCGWWVTAGFSPAVANGRAGAAAS